MDFFSHLLSELLSFWAHRQPDAPGTDDDRHAERMEGLRALAEDVKEKERVEEDEDGEDGTVEEGEAW